MDARDVPLARGTIVVVHNLRNRLFLSEHGLDHVPLMVSVADLTDRPILRKAIYERGIKAHLGVRGPVLIDSGGFSAMRGANSISIDDLIRLYRVIDGDVLAALDIPPALQDNCFVRTRKWRATLGHLDRLLASLGDDRIMPVIHGRHLAEVAKACRDVRRRISEPTTIALGGMVPFFRGAASREHVGRFASKTSMRSGVDFVADALKLCRSEFPNSRLHVFGVGSPTTAIAVLALGADSVDSLAWRHAAGFGAIFLAGCAERIVSPRARQRQSRPALSTQDRRTLGRCGCPVCARRDTIPERIQMLGESYVARGVHNVWTLLTEEAELRLAKATGTVDAFIASRITGKHRFATSILNHLLPTENC